MNKKQLFVELDPILSRREIEVVIKRLENKHITQTESNYLSRSVRPKLRSADYACKNQILDQLAYRRNKHERQRRIIGKRILFSLNGKDVKAILLFGSYVRNRHTNYRDIDALIIFNKKYWSNLHEKNELKKQIEKDSGMNIEATLTTYQDLAKLWPYSPLLRTELEEYERVYGDINLDSDIIINTRYLYSRLLEVDTIIEMWSELDPRFIYNALRSCISIRLFLGRIINNRSIIKTIEDNIGKATANSLIENTASTTQKKMALLFLKYLYAELEKILLSKNEQEKTNG